MQTDQRSEVMSLRAPDSQPLIFYQEDTDQTTLDDLSPPTSGVAVDTKQAYREIEVDLSQDATVWQAPYESDWVIAIGKF